MTALIHYERQQWKKVNFFAKKPLPRSLFQHVQTLCMPSFIDLHTHATPGHVTSFGCSRNTSDRSLAWSHHRRRSTRAIDRDRGETWNTSGKPHAVACCTSRSTGAVGAGIVLRLVTVINRSWPVTNARRPRTGRERRPWWRPSETSYLTVWMNDRFFASLVHCMLRRLLSEYWRKETEKSKVFLWGGRFGRSLLCPGRAEKKTRGSWPTTGCLPVDRNKLGPDSAGWERSLIPDRHAHTHTHTHTHTELKRRGPPGPRR